MAHSTVHVISIARVYNIFRHGTYIRQHSSTPAVASEIGFLSLFICIRMTQDFHHWNFQKAASSSLLMLYFSKSGDFPTLTPHFPNWNTLILDSTASNKGLTLSCQKSHFSSTSLLILTLSQLLLMPWTEEDDKIEEMILNNVDIYWREGWNERGGWGWIWPKNTLHTCLKMS